MNRRAYARFMTAITVSLLTLAATAPVSAHTGQQVFDTLESITGEQPDLSTPIPQYVSLQFDVIDASSLNHLTPPRLFQAE